MNPQIFAAASQGIGGITEYFSQKVRHEHEKALNERTIEAQRQASQFEWDKNLEQWNRANQYNAPTEQMSRLREAGLNPAMIYGSGGAKTTAAVSPKYQAPRPTYSYAPPADPTAILGAYNDFRMKNAQVDLLRSQAETARAEAENAQQYHWGRGKKSIVDAKHSLLDYQWKTERTGRRPNQFKMLDTSLQAAQARNELTSKMITGQSHRNTLLDLDIETYMLRNLGAGALNLLKTGMKALKPSLRGISKKFPVKEKSLSPLQKWKNNDVMKNYRTTAFD